MRCISVANLSRMRGCSLNSLSVILFIRDIGFLNGSFKNKEFGKTHRPIWGISMFRNLERWGITWRD